jgi:hypothetical protein
MQEQDMEMRIHTDLSSSCLSVSATASTAGRHSSRDTTNDVKVVPGVLDSEVGESGATRNSSAGSMHEFGCSVNKKVRCDNSDSKSSKGAVEVHCEVDAFENSID